MQKILIKDITQSHRAISALDGEKIYNKLLSHFENSEKVVLDFEGIELTITAFLNSSIGKLYAKYDYQFLKEMLDIKNMNSEELLLLKLVIEKAKERFSKNYPSNLDNIDFVNED